MFFFNPSLSSSSHKMKLSNTWEIQLVVPAWPAFRGQVPSEAWGCYLVSDKLSHLFFEKLKVFFLSPCRQIYQEESHESFNGIPVWERTLLDELIFSWRPGNISFNDREISVLMIGKYQFWQQGNIKISLDGWEICILTKWKHQSWKQGNITLDDWEISKLRTRKSVLIIGKHQLWHHLDINPYDRESLLMTGKYKFVLLSGNIILDRREI